MQRENEMHVLKQESVSMWGGRGEVCTGSFCYIAQDFMFFSKTSLK